MLQTIVLCKKSVIMTLSKPKEKKRAKRTLYLLVNFWRETELDESRSVMAKTKEKDNTVLVDVLN